MTALNVIVRTICCVHISQIKEKLDVPIVIDITMKKVSITKFRRLLVG